MALIGFINGHCSHQTTQVATTALFTVRTIFKLQLMQGMYLLMAHRLPRFRNNHKVVGSDPTPLGENKDEAEHINKNIFIWAFTRLT